MERLKQLSSQIIETASLMAGVSRAAGDFGLIGLSTAGQNITFSAAEHGYNVVACSTSNSESSRLFKRNALSKSVTVAQSAQELVGMLKKPRRVFLVVEAGAPVDTVISQLLPYLERSDIIVDAGDSHFRDTSRRCEQLGSRGIHFLGVGITPGGVSGVTGRPTFSMMSGGAEEAWSQLRDIFQSISANFNGAPCCGWIGPAGSGHYAKMVRDGIELGDMQLICEAYDILKKAGNFTSREIGDVFARWNSDVLSSSLLEIAVTILHSDDASKTALSAKKIADTVDLTDSGKWAVISALDLGTPLTSIGEAALARFLLSLGAERSVASTTLRGPEIPADAIPARTKFADDLMQALYASRIISYAQGFMLMKQAADEFGWNLNYSAIASIWAGDFTIRSRLLSSIASAFKKSPNLSNLMFHRFFIDAAREAQNGWRNTVAFTTKYGIPAPAISAALTFYDGYRSANLPANLLQAQRDYFGAHTFKVKPEFASVSLPINKAIHVNWTGKGGEVSASTYNA